jgi:undecaprenyl-diphosphatase
MWFGLGAKNIVERDRNQRAVAVAMIALGFANLAVFVINHHYVRLRPFVSYDEVTLLFYEPTDISSFPANPAAVAAAMATGVWLRSWKAGAAFAAVGLLWAFGRVYAGVCYPLDVLAGAGIGITIAILSHLWLWTMEPLPTIIFRVAAYFHIASPPPPLEEGRRRAPLYKLLGRFVQ